MSMSPRPSSPAAQLLAKFLPAGTLLWALVCTAEALKQSGITDPYELYKHMHPSDIGTSLGSGMGGTESLAKMFKDRREEKEVQNDILQET